MARYSNAESLKIEYFKSKIKEIRYLKYKLSLTESRIEEINFYLIRISNLNKLNGNIKKVHSDTNTVEKWNNLIQEKNELITRIKNIKKELNYAERVLDGLSPTVKAIAIDLLIRKYSMEKVRDKYYVSNPYQCINDELKYLEIDDF